MKYFFVLGKNPKLSVAEIKAVVKNGNFNIADNILFLDTDELNALTLIKHLGGTIKIGEILGKIDGLNNLKELVLSPPKFCGTKLERTNKTYFGISNYADSSAQDIKRTAMEIKKSLKSSGPVRW